MTLRTLIVDDEPIARKRLRRLLGDHPDVEIVAEAGNGDEAIALTMKLRPDLLLLDVSMPGKTGLDALKVLHSLLPEELRPLVVFTTAYEQHAVPAFAMAGTDYLLKPVEKADLERALLRVRKTMFARERTPPPVSTPELPAADMGAAPQRVEHLAAQHAGKILRLAVADIACVVVEDELTFACTPQGRFLVNTPLHDLERRLPSPPFVQISRSCIVSLAWIEHVEPGTSGTLVATLRAPLQLRLEVARRRVRALRDLLAF